MSDEAKVNVTMMHIYVFIVNASILNSYSYYMYTFFMLSIIIDIRRTGFVENSQ